MKKIVFAIVVAVVAFGSAMAADAVKGLTDMQSLTLIDKAQRPFVIDFSATWCGPCRLFAPTYHEVAEELGSKIDFYQVDVDDNPLLCQKYRIEAVPTVVIVNPQTGRKQVITGLVDKPTFYNAINKILE